MKKRNGFVRVSLQVSEEYFAFVEAMAKANGYFGPEDCLNGVLNTAILRLMVNPPLEMPIHVYDEDDDADVIVEDEGGGIRLADDVGEDDEIPF